MVTLQLATGANSMTKAVLVKGLGTEFEQQLPLLIADLLGAADTPPPPELARNLVYVTQFAPTFSLRRMLARGLGLL